MSKQTENLFKHLDTQVVLFPEDIGDRIGANHAVRLVNEVVDNLNIDAIIKQYKGGGASSFSPRMMLKVLFYSYLNNTYSCRKIEKALVDNIHFMWLSGNSMPDFRTINYFRGKRLKGQIQQLFADVVRMLHELDYVSLDMQYIDGTKIESVSNRYTFVWKGSVEKNKAKLEQKIRSVLGDIEAQIKTDQEPGNEEAPKAIDSAELRARLGVLNGKLKEKPDESGKDLNKQLETLEEKHLPKLEEYEQKLRTIGSRNSYSKTDESATFMRLKDDHMNNGQLKPAYNAQISTEEQLITHFSIHQTAGDTTTLPQHLNSFKEAYGKQSNDVVADAGYGSEENFELMEAQNIDAYVKYNQFHAEQKRRQKQNPFLPQNIHYNKERDYYVCPMGQHMEKVGEGKRVSSNGYEAQVSYYEARRCEGCPMRGMCHKGKGNRLIEVSHRLNELRAKARERLNSELGKAHRSKRPIEVEAVFGQMKSNNKFTRFTLRGLEKVGIEFGLMALGHNLRKMAKKAQDKAKNMLKEVFLKIFAPVLPMADAA